MQPLTKVQAFMLFALGTCHEQFDKRFSDRPMSLIIAKSEFIDLAHKAGIVSKKDRAVYKNLQDLEEKKFIAYNNKSLSLTKKGEKEFNKIRNDIKPFITVAGILEGNDILRYIEKKQTVLR